MKKIEIVTQHLPGYGSPEEWHSRVIYDNRLLEEFITYTQFQLGSQTTTYRQKWDKIFKTATFQELVDKAPLASPLCDVCGSNTLDGGSSCVEMYFCKKCSADGTLDQYRQEYKDKQAQYKIDQDTKYKEQEEARHQEALSAMNCFHWRDNLFFKRLDDGSVQITKIEPNKYDHETQQSIRYEMIRHQYIIPPNEWASIIASVSLCGETSEKYYSAVDFHANKQ